jgi:competence protein ComEA
VCGARDAHAPRIHGSCHDSGRAPRTKANPLPSATAIAASLAIVLGLPPSMCWALEVNSASRAELEQLPGLGPGKVDRMLKERQRAAFASWQDLARRVPGFGAKTAASLSREGLTVNQHAFDASSDRRPKPAP